MPHDILIKTEAVIEFTGKTVTRETRYRVSKDDRGYLARSLYLTATGVVMESNCWYSGLVSLHQLRDMEQDETNKWAARSGKMAQEAEEAAARFAAAKPAFERIVEAFGYAPDSWETDVWELVSTTMGQELVDVVGSDSGVALRKRLRPAMTEAKETARYEYPEDYREEEDKDDFYAGYVDDIAGWIVEALA